MWPFKKKTIVGTLSNVAFARWLRAGSPQPLLEFLTYDEDHQETLAGIGDDFAEDRAETAAAAIGEILTAIAEGLAEGGEPPTVDEGVLAEMIARGETPQNRSGAKPGPKPLSMGGVTARRSQRIQADQDDADEPRRLCGLLPDSMRPDNAPPDNAPPDDDNAPEEAIG
jgi:hypothetical protein